ncbi:hypothetical protein L1887_45867 [Cichorium endivia]|nr:hypothetical protein L1887_45867 [Cichorium endivia]
MSSNSRPVNLANFHILRVLIMTYPSCVAIGKIKYPARLKEKLLSKSNSNVVIELENQISLNECHQLLTEIAPVEDLEQELSSSKNEIPPGFEEVASKGDCLKEDESCYDFEHIMEVLPAFLGNVPASLKNGYPSAKITCLGNCEKEYYKQRCATLNSWNEEGILVVRERASTDDSKPIGAFILIAGHNRSGPNDALC